MAVWQILGWTGVLDARTLASPLEILQSAVEYTRSGLLPEAVLASLQRVAVGFALGATLATVLALVAGLSRLGDDAIGPPMQMLRTLPHFGLIPLFILWMGIGETPRLQAADLAPGVVTGGPAGPKGDKGDTGATGRLAPPAVPSPTPT